MRKSGYDTAGTSGSAKPVPSNDVHDFINVEAESVPKVCPPAAINAVAQPYSKQHGSVGVFFKSCADLFSALTREACFLDRLQEKHRLAFRELYGTFHFRVTGSLAGQGELDKVLDVSARLKDQTTLILVQIAKILCSEETGLFHVIDKAAINRTLRDQRQGLLSLLDSFKINSYQSDDSDTDSVLSGDDDAVFAVEPVLDELATFVGCLTKLEFALDHPAPDPAPAPDMANTPSSSRTGPAAYSVMIRSGRFSAANLLSTLQPDSQHSFGENKDPYEDDGDYKQFKLMSDKKVVGNQPRPHWSLILDARPY